MRRLTRKQIEAMPYGSPEQMQAADAWIQHLMSLLLRTREVQIEGGTVAFWWLESLATTSRIIHTRDIWYQARRRWNEAVRGSAIVA